MLNKETSNIASALKNGLLQLYGQRLEKLLLFGSHARGDYRDDSDIDFMIVLNDEKLNVSKEIKHIVKVKHPLILEHNKEINSIPISLNRYETERSPLLYFVRKEAIEV
ncbi:MAG: nucleotidyltransferase domain-containing protein [Bacteroidota bacterium]